MMVALLGILTLVKLSQKRNALSPMLVTLSGMVISPDFAPGHFKSSVLSLSYKIPLKLL